MAGEQAILRQVLTRFPAAGLPPWQQLQMESLGGAGGFSGARFWRIRVASALYCLRRWPTEHPSPERLAFIHKVLRHVFQRGVSVVPVPVPADDGNSFIEVDEHLWELTPWLPGKADYRDASSPARLQAALTTLARFHVAAATFPRSRPNLAPSPGLRQRREILQRWLSGDCDRLAARITAGDWPALAERARRLLPLFRELAPEVRRCLAEASPVPLPGQPVLRDIWHDHVLFEGERVSGIVDFGAMRIDTPAGDVARLLGSLALDDEQVWRAGLSAYESQRPLSAEERRAVTVFDRSTTLFSGMNWLRWIYLEGRVFDERRRVEARLDEILERLSKVKGIR